MTLFVPAGTLLYAAATLAFLAGSVLAARRVGVSPWRVLVLMAALVFAFFVGARLHYLVAHRHVALAGGGAVLFGKGAHMPGGIALCLVLGVAGTWLLGLPLARLGDALVPAFGASVFLGRLGCFANGCCFGAPTDLPWGVPFGKGTGPFTVHVLRGWIPHDAAHAAAVHPTQIYFAAVGLLIVLVGLAWPRVQRRAGETWLLSVAVWGVANPIVESFRDPGYLTGSPHLGMSGAVIGGVTLVAFLAWRHAARPAMPASVAPSRVGSVTS
jgi:phosphatidylglycerol:prolipoprotein diacylglycerol transferase